MSEAKIDPLNDIRQYSPTLTISQVLKFCEKKNIGITRAMIQNYIRDGLLPPPVGRRFYTHKHLAALVTIDRLKTVFEIPAIRAALVPLFDDEGLPLEVYAEISEKSAELSREFLGKLVESEGNTLLKMACAAKIKEGIV